MDCLFKSRASNSDKTTTPVRPTNPKEKMMCITPIVVDTHKDHIESQKNFFVFIATRIWIPIHHIIVDTNGNVPLGIINVVQLLLYLSRK